MTSPQATALGTRMSRLRSWLPRGGSLEGEAWSTRHRGITILAWLHVPVLAVTALVEGAGTGTWLGLTAVALLALGASWRSGPRTALSSCATLSLLGSTALLIHLFGGLIELHFHFFVVIAVVAIYQSWTPYLLALGFVLAHHALMGVAMPMAVYNHPDAMAHPVVFAVIHAAFVLAESVACLTYWKITEQALDREREQRQRAETSSQALEVAHREISDLMAIVSHDLRSPLTVINGTVELTLDGWEELTEDERKEMVRRVGAAGWSLEQMLSGTLTLAALDADGLSPRTTTFRLDTFVRETLGTLAGVLPGVDLSGLEPTMAVADRQHLQQVVGNLVTNAAKYGEAPFVVETRHVGDVVELVVSDSGAGVPEEFVPRLFDRYSRSESARRGRQRGTGLGLYIVRTLLEANAGAISYGARRGGGGRFTVTLPPGPHVLPTAYAHAAVSHSSGAGSIPADGRESTA